MTRHREVLAWSALLASVSPALADTPSPDHEALPRACFAYGGGSGYQPPSYPTPSGASASRLQSTLTSECNDGIDNDNDGDIDTDDSQCDGPLDIIEGPFRPDELFPLSWWDGSDAATMNVDGDGAGAIPAVGEALLRWETQVGVGVLTQIGPSSPSFTGQSVAFTLTDASSPYVRAELEDRQPGSLKRFTRLHNGRSSSVWLRARIYDSPELQTVFDTRDDGLTTPAAALFLESDGTVSFVRRSANNSTVNSASTVLQPYKWHDIFLTFSGNDMNVYVDGTASTSNPIIIAGSADSGAHGSPLLVAMKHNGSARNLLGEIAHLAFFDFVLSPTDRDALRDYAVPANTAPIVEEQLRLGTPYETPITLGRTDFTITDPDGPLARPIISCLPGKDYTGAGANGCILTPDPGFSGDLTVGIVPTDQVDEGPPYYATLTVFAEGKTPECMDEVDNDNDGDVDTDDAECDDAFDVVEGPFRPDELHPLSWWDGSDATTMNVDEDGSGPAPLVGDTLLRWEARGGIGALTTVGASNPSFTGQSVAFTLADFASPHVAAQLEDEQPDKLSRFSLLHDGRDSTVWLRARIYDSPGIQTVFDTRNASLTEPASALFLEANGTVSWVRRSADNTTINAASTILEPYTWHDVFLTVSGDELRVYVDDTPSASNPLMIAGTADIGDHGSPLLVGMKHQGAARSLLGEVSHLAFFDFVVSAAERAAIRTYAVPANVAPIIEAQFELSTAYETPITVGRSDFTITDPDGPLSRPIISCLPGNDYVSSGRNGCILTPDLGFSGELTVGVVPTDQVNEGPPFYAVVTVDEKGNNPPRITSQSTVTGSEDKRVTLSISDFTIVDADGPGPNTITCRSGANYTRSGCRITPAKNYSGTLTVPVVPDDGVDTGPVYDAQITITAVNDAPTISPRITLTTPEDQAISVLLSDFTLTDPDGPGPNTITCWNNPNYTRSGCRITPSANFVGTLTVPVVPNDGLTNGPAANLSIAVTAVNDPPAITGQAAITTPEDTAATVFASSFTITDVDGPGPNTISCRNGANYTRSGCTITPSANFTGTLTIPVVPNDGLINGPSYNATMTVTAVNDPPAITGQAAITTPEDTAATLSAGSFTITDVDGPGPNTISCRNGANYTRSGCTITPDRDYNGTLTIPVVPSDGLTNGATYNATMTVTAVNDPPTISAQPSFQTPEDVGIALTGFTGDDPDVGDVHTFVCSNGTNYSNSAGSCTITPDPDFNGTLTVPVRADDGTVSGPVYSATVDVTAVNDPPEITGAVTSLETDENVAITLVAADFTIDDPDGPGPYTVACANGSNYSRAGCTITPATGYTGTLTVAVTPDDGTDAGTSFNATITVKAASTSGPGGSSSECNDGIDNDGDGLIDFGLDLGCFDDTLDTTEGGINSRGLVTSTDPDATMDGISIQLFEPVFEHPGGAGNTITFVDRANGSNGNGCATTNDDTGKAKPVKTIQYCINNCVDDGDADWCLVAAGQTYPESIDFKGKSGQGLDAQIVVAPYDDSSNVTAIERPIINGFSGLDDEQHVVIHGFEVSRVVATPVGWFGKQAAENVLMSHIHIPGSKPWACAQITGPNSMRHFSFGDGTQGCENSVIQSDHADRTVMADNVFYGELNKNHFVYGFLNGATTNSDYAHIALRNWGYQTNRSRRSGNGLMIRPGGLVADNVLRNFYWRATTGGACDDGSGGTGKTCGTGRCLPCAPDRLVLYDNNLGFEVGPIGLFSYETSFMDDSKETTWQSTDFCGDASGSGPGLPGWTHENRRENLKTIDEEDYCDAEVPGGCTDYDDFWDQLIEAKSGDLGDYGTWTSARNAQDWFRSEGDGCRDCYARGGAATGNCGGGGGGRADAGVPD